MRKRSINQALFIALLPLLSLAGKAQNLVLQIAEVKQGKGPIMIAVFQSAKGFPYDHKQAIALHRAEPKKGSASLNISLPEGRYAIALFQDSNEDGKLNTNFMGVPKEGYGVSNNAYNLFSAPQFKDAAFDHKGKTVLKINMKY